MKRWQIEQILSLNDIGKTKLAMPDTGQIQGRSTQPLTFKKEHILRVCARRLVGYVLNFF